MKITINGKEEELQDGVNMTDLLTSRKIRAEMVSIELNGEILHRDKFSATQLSEGDKLEFLYYMGGGRDQRTVPERGHK